MFRYFKPFLFIIFIFFYTQNAFSLSSLDVAFYGPTLSSYLNSMTISSDLSTNNNTLISFRNSIINQSSFNKSAFINYPSETNSIYTKLQTFYNARTTQNSSFLNTLYLTLGDAKNRYFFDSSTQLPNVTNWYSIVGSELTLFSNFSQLLGTCTTPNILLSNIVQSASYDRIYFQDYPSTTNSIYSKMTAFFQNRTANLQTNVNFLQNLLDLFNASMGKNFLTGTENAAVTSWIATISSEKVKLDMILTNLGTYLTQYQNDPVSLNKYLISDSNYALSYLQNYPSSSFSVYTVLNSMFTNRETQYLANKTFLTNLQTALTNAKTKPFLTTDQQNSIGTLLTTLNQDITLVNGFSTAFSAATTIATLTSLISTYNRALFQNAPSTTSNIYTKIQTFFNQRTQTQADLTNVKNLLLAAQNKNCFTSNQNTDINTWIQTINTELNKLTSTTSATYNFTFTPISGIPGAAYSNANWKISPAGNITLQFKANTSNNIYIHFYSYAVSNYVAWQQWGWYYHVKIDPYEADFYCFNGQDSSGKTVSIATAAGTSLLPNTSIKVTPNVTEDWWVVLNNNKQIFVGKGTSPGQGTMASWTIPSGFVISAPTYFGLGGASAQTTYTNIQWTGTIPSSLTTPAPAAAPAAPTTSATTASISSSTALVSGSGGSTGAAGGAMAASGSAYVPTASTFTFDPAVYGSTSVVFNSTNWVAPTGSEGNFAIKFRARGQKDIYVQFSPQPSTTLGNVYTLNIGGNSNTQTLVRNNTSGTGATTIGNAVTASNTLITGGLPGDGSTWDDYWVRIINNNIFSFGKSTTVGINEVARWTIAQPTTQSVKYIALGGYTSIIEFTNIQIASIAASAAASSASIDPSIAIKSNFTSALTNATNIDKVSAIVNNSDFNKTYLQNYPSNTNSIYTKLKDLFDNRIKNYLSDTNLLKNLQGTLTNLQNLLNQAKTKDFLAGTSISDGQKKDVSDWSSTLSAEKNLLTSFDNQFSTITTINSLIDLVKNTTINTPVLIDYPNQFNSIYSKIKDFFNIRTLVSNKNITFYSNLKTLLDYARDKTFLSDSQNSDINSCSTQVAQEFETLTTRKTASSSQTQITTTEQQSTLSPSSSQATRKQPLPSPKSEIRSRIDRQESKVVIR